MRVLTLLTCLILTTHLLYAQTVWQIDPEHSSVQFEVPHLTVSTVPGYFTKFSGEARTNGDDFEFSKISAVIDASSITTHNLERDKHLKDKDFFDIENYPHIEFKSKEVKKNKDGTYRIDGDLTIKDVTRPISLNAQYAGIILLDGEKRAGFTAEGSLNRFEYGLRWSDSLDSGGLIVGEDVDIVLNITFIQK